MQTSSLFLSKLHIIQLLVWYVAITSWFVKIEPGLTDIMMLLFILLTMLFFGGKLIYLVRGLWLLFVGFLFFELIAVTNSRLDINHGMFFSFVTIYLVVFMICLAGMLRLDGKKIFSYLMDGWVIGALCSSIAVLLALLGIIPKDYMTKNIDGHRLAGFFKDPNVFAPYLVPPMIYLLGFRDNIITRNFSIPFSYLFFMLIFTSFLLAFSRAAYVNFVLSCLLFYLLKNCINLNFSSFIISIFKIVAFMAILVFFTFQITVYLNLDSTLFSRLAIQEYDTSRYQNYFNAIDFAIDNPLGMGPGQFKFQSYNGIHSLFLAVFTESGVFTFIFFMGFLLASFFNSFVKILKSPIDEKIYFVFIFSVLSGVYINSLVLNTIHWRHMYILIALGFGSYRLMTKSKPVNE